MGARLHAFVQHADDLDESLLYHAIEDDVHRIGDGRLAAFLAAVSNMEAADAGP